MLASDWNFSSAQRYLIIAEMPCCQGHEISMTPRGKIILIKPEDIVVEELQNQEHLRISFPTPGNLRCLRTSDTKISLISGFVWPKAQENALTLYQGRQYSDYDIIRKND